MPSNKLEPSKQVSTPSNSGKLYKAKVGHGQGTGKRDKATKND